MRTKILAYLLVISMILQPMGSVVYAAELPGAVMQEDQSVTVWEEESVSEEASDIMAAAETEESSQTESVAAEAESIGMPAESVQSDANAEEVTEAESSASQETPSAEETEIESIITETAESAETEVIESEVMESETSESAETETETVTETETEAETVTETETETETETVAEIETETETEEWLGAASIDESMSEYCVNPTAEAGSYIVDVQFDSNSYINNGYILYTTDSQKTFYDDKTYLTSSEFSNAVYEDDYRTANIYDDYDYDSYGEYRYHYNWTWHNLKPSTTYYYRIVRKSGSNYYFLTETQTITTKEAVVESKVSVTDFAVKEIGEKNVRISFTVNNPGNEYIVQNRVAIHNVTNGVTSYYNLKEGMSREVTMSLAQGENDIYYSYFVYTGNTDESTEIEGDHISVTPVLYTEVPQIEVDVNSVTAKVSISLNEFPLIDRYSLGTPYVYYQEKGSEDYISKYAYFPNTEERGTADLKTLVNLESLKSGTEYECWAEITFTGNVLKSEVKTFTTAAETVLTDKDIPDENLRNALKSTLNVEELTNTNLETLTYFSYSNSTAAISDLKGIEYLTNLTNLSFYNQAFTTANEIESLKNLEYLTIQNSKLEVCPDFNKLPELYNLTLTGNEITAFPGISGLIELNYLSLYDNQLTQIGKLENLPNLYSISLYDNKLTALPEMIGLTKLQNLNVYRNQLTSLENLTGLPSLEFLYVYDNKLTTLGNLTDLPKLKRIDANSNPLTSVGNLSGLTAIDILDISHSKQLTSLDGIGTVPSLTSLHVNYSALKRLGNLSGLTGLTYINLEGNQLQNLEGISNVSSLLTIWASTNEITDPGDFSGLKNLQTLALSNNYICTMPDLSENTSLNLLYIDGNGLTSITDLSGNSALTSLDLDDNYLTESELTSEKLPVNFASDTDWISNTLATQKKLVDNSAVAFTDIKVTELGYTAASVDVKLSNELLEEFNYVYLVDQNGEKIAEYYVYAPESVMSMTYTFALPERDKTLNLRAYVRVFNGGKQPLDIYSESVQLIPPSAKEFTPSVNVKTVGNWVNVEVISENWCPIDDDYIGIEFTYREEGGNAKKYYTSFNYDGESKFSLKLNENAVYSYTLEFVLEDGTKLIDSKTGTFTAGKEAVPEPEIIVKPVTDRAVVYMKLNNLNPYVYQNMYSSYFYYRKKGDTSWNSKYVSWNGTLEDEIGSVEADAISLTYLSQNTEYEYYLYVRTESDTYEFGNGTFKTLEEKVLTEEDIPDANLRNALMSRLGTDTLTNTNLARLTSFSYYDEDAPIEDLKGLEYLVSVTSLGFGGQKFDDLDVITSLPSLTSLNVNACELDNVSDFSSFSNIRSLTLQEMDLGSVKEITLPAALTSLTLYECSLNEIPLLKGTEKLSYLYLQENQISELKNLSGLTSLTGLCLDNNQLESLNGIYVLTNLSSLEVNHNRIKYLPDLSALQELYRLEASYNYLQTVPDLSELSSLRYIVLNNNAIRVMPDFSGLTDLYDLNLNENYMAEENEDSVNSKLPAEFVNDCPWWAAETLASQNAWLEESKVTLSIEEVVSVGYAAAELKIRINNPQREEIEYLYVIDENNEEIDRIYLYSTSSSYSDEITVPFDDATKKNTVRLYTEMYVQNKQAVDIYSEAVELTPVSASGFKPELELLCGGASVKFFFNQKEWYEADRYNISAEVILEKDDVLVTKKTGDFNSNGSAEVALELEESTEYSYTVRYLSQNGQQIGNAVTGTVTTKENKVYEDSIFPDAALRAAVKEKIGGSYVTFTSSNLAMITSLHIYSNDDIVKDLTGIAYLENLRELTIDGHEITSADQLSGLTELEEIDLYGNDLTEMPDLSGCTKLAVIDLRYNQITESSFTKDKLPAGFLTENPGWITEQIESQRPDFEVRTAPQYYSTAASQWPFIIGVKGLKKRQRYYLNVTVDGTSYSANSYMGGSNYESFLIVKDIYLDTSESETKTVSFTLTGNDGILYKETNVEVDFVDGKMQSYARYMNATDTYVYTYVNLTDAEYENLGEPLELQIAENGQILGTSSYIETEEYSSGYDDRYQDIFGENLDTGLHYYQIFGRINLSKYLKEGVYDVYLVCENGTKIEEDLITVTAECVIENVNSYNDIDAGDYVYLMVNGYNVDHTRVRPVVKDSDGNEILKYVGLENLAGYFSDDTTIYKYQKIGDIWNSDDYINAEWSLTADAGYKYHDVSEDHEIGFESYDRIKTVHYNYKKEVVEIKFKSELANGTYVDVIVSDSESLDSDDCTIYAYASAQFNNGWISAALKDTEGNAFIPSRFRRYYIHLQYNNGQYDTSRNIHDYIEWFNYNEMGSGDPDEYEWMSTDPIRTTDKSIALFGRTELEEGTQTELVLLAPDDSVIVEHSYIIPEEDDFDYEFKLDDDIALIPGTYTIQMNYDGMSYLSTGVFVYDTDVFYMDDNYGWIEDGTIYVYYSSEVTSLEAYRNDGIDLTNKSDYEVTVYDRMGNEIEGAVLERVYQPSNQKRDIFFEISNVPADEYIGFYVKITKNGKAGVLTYDPDTYYYATDDNCNVNYGYWVKEKVEDSYAYLEADNYISHGYYGVYGYGDCYPLTVKVNEHGKDQTAAEFKISASYKDKLYSFTGADLKGTNDKTLYDIIIVSAQGKTISFETGYIVCKQDPVYVTGIKLNKSEMTLTLEEGSNMASLEVTYTPANANTYNYVEWSTSDEQIAAVENGVVKAISPGIAVITARTENHKYATCTVRVVDYSISDTELTMNAGERKQLTVFDGTNILEADWTTSNEAAAVVDEYGVVEAVDRGEAIITAALSNGVILTCNVTVTNELKSIAFQKTEEILEVGDEDILVVSYMPATEADSAAKSWSVFPEGVVTVENGIVNAIAAGQATVTLTVTTESGNELKAECFYDVRQKDIAEEIPEEFVVYAVTNFDTSLEDLADQLPDDWEWAAPETLLKPFAGMMQKDFTVQHINSNDEEKVEYDVVTVKLATITGIALENMPVKIVAGEEASVVTAVYTVVGEEALQARLAGENGTDALKLTWNVGYPAKAKTDVVLYEINDDGNGTISLYGLKAGNTQIQVDLRSGDKVAASLTQKIAVAANKTGVADIDFKLINADGSEVVLNNGVYEIYAGETVYLLDSTPVSDVTGKAFKIAYKAADTAVVKVGKANKAEPAKTPVTSLKAGTTAIIATSNDVVKTAESIYVKVIDNTSASITLSNSKLKFNAAKSDVSETVYVNNGFGGNLIDAVISDTAAAEIVSFSPDGKICICPVMGGKAVLTVTVSDENAVTVTKEFALDLKVENKMPAVTVKQTKKLNTFYKNAWGLMSVGAAGQKITDVRIAEEDFGYEYIYADGVLRVKAADKITNKKCTLLIYLEGYAEPVKKAVTIATETAALSLASASGTVYGDDYATMKTQIMDKSSKQAIDLTDVNAVVDNQNYEVYCEGNALYLIAEKLPAKQEKVNITISCPEKWNESRTFAFTVKRADVAKASLKLDAKNLTLYSYGRNSANNSIATGISLNGINVASDLLENLQIIPADSNAKAVFNQTLIVAYDVQTSQIKAKINGEGPANGTYKFNITLNDDMLSKPLKASLAVKVVKVADINSCAKVAVKGKIDILDRDGTSVTLTPKFTSLGTNAKVTNISLTGKDAHLFEIVDRTNNIATLQLREDKNVITKYKYSVNVRYTVKSGDTALTITSSPVFVTLTQGKAKTAVSGANLFSSTKQESKAIDFVVSNSMNERIEIEDVKLVNFQNAFEYDHESGTLKHLANGETARGKSYSLKFEIYANNRADNEKPVTVTYKVQIVK